jgi:hypothetical protein
LGTPAVNKDFAKLEYSKISFTWSIVGWSIFSNLIIILATILFFTLKHFRYQLNTLYTAFNANNHQALRHFIIDFCTQYNLNNLSNPAIKTPNVQNPS